MRVLGVDSSYRATGLAYIDNGILIDTLLISTKKEVTTGRVLFVHENHLNNFCWRKKIDLIVVEQVSDRMNMDTIRKLSMVEGIFYFWAEKKKTRVEPIKPKEARKIVMDKGNASKSEVVEHAKMLFPMLAQKSEHEAEAAIIAVAGGQKYA